MQHVKPFYVPLPSSLLHVTIADRLFESILKLVYYRRKSSSSMNDVRVMNKIKRAYIQLCFFL